MSLKQSVFGLHQLDLRVVLVLLVPVESVSHLGRGQGHAGFLLVDARRPSPLPRSSMRRNLELNTRLLGPANQLAALALL
ncbi:hypothetical protein P8C59_003269 [Phyllachora maydis]|uniref:Secreted protein n=1 Tax=Phyllachora maydis TaxID=1825666 RepID=A0AAD9I0B4_9PEZI|nr:hypothetical protein P8C59_003269 [Phyllachora maydis]